MPEAITLEDRKERFRASTSGTKPRVTVCAGTGCMANGSMRIYERFREVLGARGIRASVALEAEGGDYQMIETGCQGFCQMGPLVTLKPQGVMYVKVKAEDVDEIVEESILGGRHVERLLYTRPDSGEPVHEMSRIPFYERQHRLMLELCGNIDVHDLDEYVEHGGYFQARRAVLEMTDAQICQEILASGLKGRGGGGFPTGRKWDLTRANAADEKYVVCNGDEGDPGAFMDRCVMEGNPHAVLEGMIIAAMAVNATFGYIYVRMEYPLAVKRLKYAITAAREAGILGASVFGSGRGFDVEVKEGAGAFVCGEETALISSIEGRRGMPTLKPPYPAEAGLFGKPTVINNVETLATVPVVLRMGAEKYAGMGTANAKGTKTFALTGHVANTGLIEVPFGTTLREIVADIGGGVTADDGSLVGCDFKAVQIGGPSGGCLTRDHLDLPLDYESLQGVGAMVGSGGLVVMNQTTCMVQISRFFMQFTQNESCGKCVVCREGTRQMLAFLDDIIEGRGTLDTIALLEDLAKAVKVGSLCGLGKTAPNPVLSSLRYFREEYLAHVVQRRCPAGACTALLTYRILADRCKGCTVCAKNCPAEAITGKKGSPFVIDPEKCVKCGVCEQKCKFKAVVKG
ncbi:MAG: NAD(P)H-dependent oxidoreductase subunit E [Deltaproteobacteria bacterium]|jgi:NADH-quinone oxidoreductase subunit F|nr:NAD(P)H-dependent oxidoreductase subunit E [Deltaproteobacteria bacterium]